MYVVRVWRGYHLLISYTTPARIFEQDNDLLTIMNYYVKIALRDNLYSYTINSDNDKTCLLPSVKGLNRKLS